MNFGPVDQQTRNKLVRPLGSKSPSVFNHAVQLTDVRFTLPLNEQQQPLYVAGFSKEQLGRLVLLVAVEGHPAVPELETPGTAAGLHR